MKKIVLFVLLFSSAFTLLAQESNYISENFAILQTQAKKISSEKYVKQVIGVDFKTKDNSNVNSFSIDEIVFVDNGTLNDEKANDGIYTSTDSYNIPTDKILSFDDNGVLKITTDIHYDSHFKHKSELQSMFSNENNGKLGIGIECDIIGCTCAECHCRACNFGWGQNLNWCFKIGKCSISISW